MSNHTKSVIADEHHRRIQAEAACIDPMEAEVCWRHGNIVDPYDLHCETTPDEDCIGRLYYARRPGSEIWVEVSDLPEQCREQLSDRAERESNHPWWATGLSGSTGGWPD